MQITATPTNLGPRNFPWVFWMSIVGVEEGVREIVWPEGGEKEFEIDAEEGNVYS